MVKVSPEFVTGEQPDPHEADTNGKTHDGNGKRDTKSQTFEIIPKLIPFSKIEEQEIDWIWDGRIPAGCITLLAGPAGLGKSFLTCYMASTISLGYDWADGSPCDCGDVILMSAEDDPAKVIKPRLTWMGANCERVKLLESFYRKPVGLTPKDDEDENETFITFEDVRAIEAAIKQANNCRMVAIDPVGSYLNGTDSAKEEKIRDLLRPIAKLAEQHGLAIVLIGHYRKGASPQADDCVMGSRAFTAMSRMVWHMNPDPADKERRLWLPGKCNLGPKPKGMAFTIAGEPPKVVWEKEEVDQTADDLMEEKAAQAESNRKAPGPAPEAANDAKEWLARSLKGGGREAKDLLDEWVNGNAGSKRTLERAKVALRVVAYRNEIPGPWYWRLPTTLPDSLQDDPPHDGSPPPSADTTQETTEMTDLGDVAPPLKKLGDLGDLGDVGNFGEKQGVNSPPMVEKTQGRQDRQVTESPRGEKPKRAKKTPQTPPEGGQPTPAKTFSDLLAELEDRADDNGLISKKAQDDARTACEFSEGDFKRSVVLLMMAGQLESRDGEIRLAKPRRVPK